MTRFYHGELSSNPDAALVVWCCTDDNKFSCWGYSQPEELLHSLISLLLHVRKMGLGIIDPPSWAVGAIRRSAPVDPEIVRKAIEST